MKERGPGDGISLLVDLGGVLLRAEPRRAIERLAAMSGRSAESLEGPILGEAKAAFDVGRIDAAEFVARVEAACGLSVGAARVRDAWCGIFEDLPETQRLVARLAERHPCILASNTDPLHFAWVRARLPLLGRFRGFHLSYEAGCAKPDPEYYRLLFRRFALEPARCVLVDDLPENVEAIVKLGASGVVHVGAAATEAALAALGVVA